MVLAYIVGMIMNKFWTDKFEYRLQKKTSYRFQITRIQAGAARAEMIQDCLANMIEADAEFKRLMATLQNVQTIPPAKFLK